MQKPARPQLYLCAVMVHVPAEVQVARFVPFLLLLVSLSPAFSQHKVDPAFTHERLICVVPMIGSGTANDPRRPMFAPVPGQSSDNGILAFTYQLSDDGQHALVEFVARDRSAFTEILAPHSQALAVFEKDKQKGRDIEKELKKFKKDFKLEQLRVVLP